MANGARAEGGQGSQNSPGAGAGTALLAVFPCSFLPLTCPACPGAGAGTAVFPSLASAGAAAKGAGAGAGALALPDKLLGIKPALVRWFVNFQVMGQLVPRKLRDGKGACASGQSIALCALPSSPAPNPANQCCPVMWTPIWTCFLQCWHCAVQSAAIFQCRNATSC